MIITLHPELIQFKLGEVHFWYDGPMLADYTDQSGRQWLGAQWHPMISKPEPNVYIPWDKIQEPTLRHIVPDEEDWTGGRWEHQILVADAYSNATLAIVQCSETGRCGYFPTPIDGPEFFGPDLWIPDARRVVKT